MHNSWRPKPGDRIFRPRRIRRYHLRRVLGVPAVFSAGYGNVGILFIFTALTYAEGTAMLPEAGGSASFARHGFNDLAGFTAGWALMLSYIVTISISAFTIPPYLGYFWEGLKIDPVAGTATT